MPNKNLGELDKDLKRFSTALVPYAMEHPKAKIELMRRSDAIVLIRIIDPDFKGIGFGEREDPIWKLLEPLPQELLNQLYLLILVTPQEAKTSQASFEFDHPESIVA